MILLPLLQVTSSTVPVTFSYVVTAPVQSVHLVGTFNSWDRAAMPMSLSSDGRTYTRTLNLEPGRYQYKFIVDGSRWVVDPLAKSVDDGGGNTNSLLVLTPPDYARPASPTDGEIARSAIRHRAEPPDFNYDRGRIRLSLRVRPNDVASVEVVTGRRRHPLSLASTDELYALYAVEIPWDRKSDFRYQFALKDGDRTETLGPDGLGGKASYVITARDFRPFEVPSWVERSVLYQIFPDRFENGDPRNDPKDVAAWNGKPEWFNRFGGDVAGVRKRMDYLKRLGIQGVYFNPIFQSPSNHRYDATDYLRIDPQFGTNEEFIGLTRDLKRRGIRTVLDGVFNHTATDFFAFADIRAKGQDSSYKDWYTIHSFPVKVQNPPNYVGWYGFAAMPKVNVLQPAAKKYMLDVPRFWMDEAEIAGWRLDVANEVEPQFWREFRNTVKSKDRNAWIVGEIWGDGSPWLKGDQFDSVMNYRFREAVLKYVAPLGRASGLMSDLMTVYHSYAPQVSRNMMNLLGSHDTPRILNQCQGDRDLAKLAATLQFTWVGSPSIYYGDELGMEGAQDPDNRRGMRWDLATDQNDFLRHYRTLIALRNRSRALQSGDPLPLMTNDADGTLAFARVLGKESVVVAMNRSNIARDVRIPTRALHPAQSFFLEALSQRPVSVDPQGDLVVHLPPKGAAVLIPASSGSRNIRR